MARSVCRRVAARLAVHDFAYVTMAQGNQWDSLIVIASHQHPTPLWSPAPDLSPLSVQSQCRCPGIDGLSGMATPTWVRSLECG